MDISIIITCYNERDNIAPCLDSLLRQDYSRGLVEIVVSDGGSKDKTQDIVKGYSVMHPNIRLVVETKKGTAAGRNAGIIAAKYNYMAFIDADCEAPSDWLSILACSYLKAQAIDTDIAAVGGANIPPESADSFLKAIGISLDSFMGSFKSAQGRIFKEPVYVKSLANLNVLYKREAILKVGCFDETLLSEAEDADLNFRLSKAGYRFLFIPESFVWHKMRPTPMTWLRNMFRYGKGRARLLKRYPDMWNLSFTLPLIFSITMISTLMAPFSNLFFIPFLYFPALFLFSIYQSWKKRYPELILHVMSVYMIQHFGYAAGEIFGLLHPDVK